MRNNLFWRKQMYDSGAGSGGGSSRYYWRDGIKYSAMNDPELGHIMSDGLGNWIPDTRWQTLPIRALNNAGNFLGDAMVRGLEGYQEASGNIKKIGDALTPDGYSVPTEGPMRLAGRGVPEPVVSSGPLGRHGYRHHPGGYAIPPNSHLTPEAQAIRDTQGFGYGGDPHYYASHEIPGYDRMVNEGYDSWSPSDSEWNPPDGHFGNAFRNILEGGTEAVQQDTRSDWQKWKDSVAGGRR